MCMLIAFVLFCNNDNYSFVVLHPKFKSAYFIKASWPPKWIKPAKVLLRAQCRDNYKPMSMDSHQTQLVSQKLYVLAKLVALIQTISDRHHHPANITLPSWNCTVWDQMETQLRGGLAPPNAH